MSNPEVYEDGEAIARRIFWLTMAYSAVFLALVGIASL